MSIELTANQLQAMADDSSFPTCVVNPQTSETFVLLPTDLYERVRVVIETEDEIAAVRETYSTVAGVLEADGSGDSVKESA